jgi:SAM-dependent methyltransferase
VLATAFGPEHAEVYELTYRNRGKDWAHETGDVTRLIRSRLPGAASLLDVACGTGAHLVWFRTAFEHVEGLELAPAMRQRASRRLPAVTIHAGDMRRFNLGRTFGRGHLPVHRDRLCGDRGRAAPGDRFDGRSPGPGGVPVVEPWWFPERFIDGYVAGDVVREDGLTVARISHSTSQGLATRMESAGWWPTRPVSGRYRDRGTIAVYQG